MIGLSCFKTSDDNGEEIWYKQAICYDAKQAGYAYYNLASLYQRQKQHEKAKEMLKKCIENSENDSELLRKAKEISDKDKNESSMASDWYQCWFNHTSARRVVGLILVISLMAFIILPFYFLASIVFDSTANGNRPSHEILLVFWSVSFGVILTVLILPNLRRLKMGELFVIETEQNPNVAETSKDFNFTPTIINMKPSPLLNMPIRLTGLSFHVPIKLSENLKLLYPIEPSRIPLQYIIMYSRQYTYLSRDHQNGCKGESPKVI